MLLRTFIQETDFPRSVKRDIHPHDCRQCLGKRIECIQHQTGAANGLVAKHGGICRFNHILSTRDVVELAGSTKAWKPRLRSIKVATALKGPIDQELSIQAAIDRVLR